MYLKISPRGEIRVSAPDRLPLSAVETFLKDREKWIHKHLEKISTRVLPIDPEEEALYLGRVYAIKDLGFSKAGGKTQQGLEDLAEYLRSKAKAVISDRLNDLSTITAIPYKRLQIRDQRTRWGSSSGSGTISINWRTIMAPEEVIDYLLIHELVHQKRRNHGSDFWKMVKGYSPDYRKHDLWLKEHSFLLDLYRALPE